MPAQKTLILGIGNTLLCDEGFGIAALEYLRQNYHIPENVDLVDGGTRGLMLMAEILECDFLVVFDIVLGGEKPGTIYLIEDDEIPVRANFRHSMHQACLADTLVSCDLAGNRPHAIVFGMEPFDFQRLEASLSPQASAMLPEFCRKAVRELRRRGLEINPLQNAMPD